MARLFTELIHDSFARTSSDDYDADNLEINAVHDYCIETESGDESLSSVSSDDGMKGTNSFQWSKSPPHRALYRKQNIVRRTGGLPSVVTRL